jgi:hypothetical protein
MNEITLEQSIKKFIFINEFSKSIYVSVSLMSGDHTAAYNILLTRNMVTVHCICPALENHIHSILHICPQTHPDLPVVPPVDDIFEHDCEKIPNQFPLKFFRIPADTDTPIATIVITTDRDTSSPAPLRQQSLWKCTSMRIPPEVLQEFTGHRYFDQESQAFTHAIYPIQNALLDESAVSPKCFTFFLFIGHCYSLRSTEPIIAIYLTLETILKDKCFTSFTNKLLAGPYAPDVYVRASEGRKIHWKDVASSALCQNPPFIKISTASLTPKPHP